MLDIGADPAQPLDLVADRVVIVGLGDVQPAGNRIDAGHAGFLDCAPHVVDALLRQRPELLGVVEADALDNIVGAFAEARQHEAGVAAGRRPGHAVGFQHRHRPAAPRDLARHRQARQARRRSRRRRRRDRNSGAGAAGLQPASPRTSPPLCRLARRSLLLNALRRARMLDCRGFEIDAARVL